MLDRLASTEWRRALAAEFRVLPKALRRVVPWILRFRFGRTESLLDVALDNAKDAPHELALEMDENRLTWAQLADASSRIAHVLTSAGVTEGDVVAIFARNSPFYVALLLGVTRVGAIAALINTNLRKAPLRHAIEVSHAKVAVTEESLEDTLRQADDTSEAGGLLDSVLVFGNGPMDQALADASPTPFPPVSVDKEKDFVYIYTSGTTGLPKPCRVSHGRAIAAGASFGHLVYEFTPGDKLYSVLPLYHSSALLLGVASAMVCRVPMAMRESFSASAFWDDVHRYKATALLYIGELCRYLVNTPPHPKERPNPIRVATGNGLRPDVWPKFVERFGIKNIREFYGATEAPGFIINLTGREGSVGRVPLNGYGMLKLVHYDVDRDEHIRDEKGHCLVCTPNEVGELLIRIPESAQPGLEFRGYTDAEATAKKVMQNPFGDGENYFRTGDLLRQDADGFFYFVDRIGDTFRWKGENVSSAEVADVITKNNGVKEAAVVGVHVPGMDGQAGLIAVVTDGEFNPAKLWKAAGELPAYAQPRFVRVLSSLSTTGTFKIQKSQLKQDGVNPAEIQDTLYLRTDTGYVPLTTELWDEVISGRVKL